MLKALVLLTLVFVAIMAQTNPKGNRYYIAGSFSRVNAFSRPGPTCWDPKANTWVRSQSALKNSINGKPNVVFLNENEAYYAEQNQVWYFNGTVSIPLLGKNGVFRRQESSSAPVLGANFIRLVVNKAQDRLWIIGDFNKAGTTSFNTRGSGTLSNERIALMDITVKNDPKFIACPAPTGVIAYIPSYMYTQGRTLLVGAQMSLTSARLMRLNCDTPAWTEVMNTQQTLSSPANFKQAYGDESLFVYSTTDLLSNPPTAKQVYARLAADGTTWNLLIAGNPTALPSENLHPTLWTPTGNKEVYFVFNNPSGGANVDSNNKVGQYIWRIPETGVREAVASTAGRLSADLSLNSIPMMSSLLSDMLYDETLKTLIVMGNLRYFVTGEYISAIPDPTSGLITQDRSKYYAKPLTPGMAQLVGTGTTATFGPTLGGAFSNPSTFAAAGYYFTANLVCFRSAGTTYNVFAPYTAMYDETVNQWQAVPSLSTALEGDMIFGVQAPVITAIERIGSQFGPDAFFAGYFRTIGGTTYNSIVKYTLDGSGAPTLTALGDANGVGLQGFTNAGDNPNSGTTPDDKDYSRYYGLLPGSVSLMTYDSGAKILYVYGSFVRAGSSNVNGLARWNENTKTWSDVDGGVNGAISKMIVSGGNLYVSGSFSYAGTTHVRNIAMFNTATQKWEALAEGIAGGATDLVEYQGSIFAYSNAVSGQTLSVVHRWNPQAKTWASVLPRRTTASVEANNCLSPQCTVNNFAAFYVLGNRLYLADTSRNLYVLSGDAYEIVHNSNAGTGAPFYRNSLTSGQKIVLYNNAGTTTLYTDKMDNAFFYNADRDGAFTDGPVTVWSSASKNAGAMIMLIASLFAIALALLY